MKLLLALAMLGLCGCGTQQFWHYTAGPDWKLSKDPEIVTVISTRGWCKDIDGQYPDGCAIRNPLEKTCMIFIAANAPNRECVIRHEQKHCSGYDHPNFDYTLPGCF